MTSVQQLSLPLDISDATDDDDDDDEDKDEQKDEDYIEEEEDDDDDDDEEEEEDDDEEAEKGGIYKEPPSKIPRKQVSLELDMSDKKEQLAEVSSTSLKPLKAVNYNGNGSDIQRGIHVKMSSNTAHHRVYDKRNYCLYCEKPFAKIARHLMQKHCDKPDIAKALMHKKGSSQRNCLLTKVRNQGNYQHNCEVLASGNGQIVPRRQATNPSTAADYLPCKFCFAMYVKSDIWRHIKICKLRVKEDGPVRRKVQAACSMLLPTDTSISIGLKRVLGDMTYDHVTQVVKSDTLIISLGERMFLKNGESSRYRADMRNKMRELARLVLEAREIDKDIVFLKDLIHPGKFNTVLKAVKSMNGFNDLTNRYAVPSTPVKLRYSLVTVAQILQGEALRQQDHGLQERADQFLRLIEMEWSTLVSSNALKTLYRKKWNNPQTLPLSEDIKKLRDHLKCLEEANKKALIDHPSTKAWSELSQITLTQLIIFNRRREGEVSRMELKSYLDRNKKSMQDDILNSLSPLEKNLCNHLTRVEIEGKRGRKVPVLFPPDVKESVDLLLKTREEVGIAPNNPYIFARTHFGSEGNIRGCDTLKRFAEACGAERPENITSTKLRKHVATVSQLLNLKSHELDQLATFMGHDIEVHREYYRLPEETLQTAKVSRLLYAMESGVGQFKGQTLEGLMPNINFSAEEEPDDSERKDIPSERPTLKSQEKNSEEGKETVATSREAVGGQPSKQKVKSRRPWSKTEKNIIQCHLKQFLTEMRVPRKEDCEKCLNENPSLKDHGRDWKAIKFFVHNKIASLRRNV
nr:uncharacterized protein LOC125968056 isoform X1 [Syngnathus scovelli]XP_049589629.1 uncharacterized protein LOC125977309 isoform X1 [Syngnathus scovelli]XP_049591303.1 uncharacterized protein LOC125978199 [Syngnathus scovelli]XP_049591304.1 uncharacterized protein LOC125978199 [Syngnathus scovelli]XP_049591305.1 uncharacterized protein LOC125978200 [Syngnathus scovelli]